MRALPGSVVSTITRSGMAGGFSCANAHTVSVSTAGDMPVTAKRTVEVCGLRVEAGTGATTDFADDTDERGEDLGLVPFMVSTRSGDGAQCSSRFPPPAG